MATIKAVALEGLPEVGEGDDLAGLMVNAGPPLAADDIVVVAHKVVSKAEGRVRALSSIEPGERAIELARLLDKDARHVQAVLDEADEVVRAERGVLICRTRHGFVCANAGVDASNAPGDGLVFLPIDPDESARGLRRRLRELTGVAPGVVISDSFGRAWRHGQADVAIGAAGVTALDDWRGRRDYAGRELHATQIAIGDELAAAADLARAKDARLPVVIVSGLGHYVSAEDGMGVAALIRPLDEDLFR